MAEGRFEAYVHGTAVVRESDGRRFYVLEMGGRPDAPAHLSLVDRDASDLCEECGQALDGNAVAFDALRFHPECAPHEDGYT